MQNSPRVSFSLVVSRPKCARRNRLVSRAPLRLPPRDESLASYRMATPPLAPVLR